MTKRNYTNGKVSRLTRTKLKTPMIRAKIRSGKYTESMLFETIEDAKKWYEPFTMQGYTVSITEAKYTTL